VVAWCLSNDSANPVFVLVSSGCGSMEVYFIGNSPTRRQCSLHPSGGLHRRQRCVALRATSRTSVTETWLRVQIRTGYTSSWIAWLQKINGNQAIGIGPALLRDPPTPPSMRIRTRRFVSREQARSNALID
jgi:hypothetical protein